MSAPRWARLGFSLVAWLFAAGTVILVYLAGQGVFVTGGNYELHRNLGFIFGLLPLVLIVLSLAGRMPRLVLLLSVVLFGLMVVQSVLVRLPDLDPNIRAIHPVTGMVIVGLAFWLASSTLRELRRPLPADPGRATTAELERRADHTTATPPAAVRDDEV
jgi:cytochrome b561